MRDAADKDVEALARADIRARLGLTRLLRLYLDPFALFKNVSAGPPRSQAEALQYNRRHRDMLLAYLRRCPSSAWSSALPLPCACCFSPARSMCCSAWTSSTS